VSMEQKNINCFLKIGIRAITLIRRNEPAPTAQGEEGGVRLKLLKAQRQGEIFLFQTAVTH
jgi:hypothetical protein